VGLQRVLRGWLGQAEAARCGEARQRAPVEEQAAGLQESWSRAEEASHPKDALPFALERELRGPLAGVAALPVAGLEGRAPAEAVDEVRRLRRRGARTPERLDQLLAYSRAVSGGPSVERSPSQPDELLESLLIQLGPEVGPGVRLSWGLDGELPPRAAVDARQLLLAWRALLRNAVEHTARGAVHAVLRTRVLPISRSADRWVEIELEVLDTGVGLPPGDEERIFTPLRLSAADGGGRPSVGLALARQIAAAMGGGGPTAARRCGCGCRPRGWTRRARGPRRGGRCGWTWPTRCGRTGCASASPGWATAKAAWGPGARRPSATGRGRCSSAWACWRTPSPMMRCSRRWAGRPPRPGSGRRRASSSSPTPSCACTSSPRSSGPGSSPWARRAAAAAGAPDLAAGARPRRRRPPGGRRELRRAARGGRRRGAAGGGGRRGRRGLDSRRGRPADGGPAGARGPARGPRAAAALGGGLSPPPSPGRAPAA